jgi:hypothetical protein
MNGLVLWIISLWDRRHRVLTLWTVVMELAVYASLVLHGDTPDWQ